MASTRFSQHALFLAMSFALVTGTILPARSAKADTVFCPANASELDSMLSAATQGGQNFEIRIRGGVYVSTAQVFRVAANPGFNVSVSGGWNSSCQIQTADPTLTVLDGNNQGAVLQAGHVTGFAAPGTLTVSNLSLTRGQVQNSAGGCLQVNLNQGSPSLVFDRLILRGCRNGGVQGLGGAARIQNFTSASIILRNSLIADNFGADGGAVAIASNHANASTSLINNTIVRNTATEPGGAGGITRAFTATIAGKIFIYNNIVYGNAGGDGQVLDVNLRFGQAVDQLLFNNAVQGVTGNNLSGGGNISPASLGLVGGNNFALRGDSLLRNAGMALSPILAGTRDLDFSPRVLQGEIDIGAYEYAGVFQSGFE